jgi:phosphoribosylformylglycinamidine synthase subunit PurL
VSGNVSLYNETNGRGILPTPSIGGVGLLDDFTKSATLAFKSAGEAILLIGDTQGWLGQSVYLRDVCGREEGAPPPVDLAAEKRNGDVVRGMIHAGTATAVHDVSDGGLLIALAEMAIASGIGAQLLAAPASIVPHAGGRAGTGEDEGRRRVLHANRHVGRRCHRHRRRAAGVDRVIGDRVRALAAGLHERRELGRKP